MILGVCCVKCGKPHMIRVRCIYLETTRRISYLRTVRLPFHEAVLKTGTSVSPSGTPVLCCHSAPPLSNRCNGLGVLMLALLHKKTSKKKRHHHYWVHPLLCTRLEMGQSHMVGSWSVSFINNWVSNDFRGDCRDILKNSELYDNTATPR
jgi:hypothetical protein